MEKKCLIIMPVSDPEGYPQGHSNRVYQYIVLPACKSAGFVPVKVTDPAVNDTPFDMVKAIMEYEMAICDLSAKNAMAAYGFVIRNATSLPVTVIKDIKTKLTDSLVEFDLVEYDESLRIDTVQKEIETLSDALTKTFANKGESHSLLRRLEIGSVKIMETLNTSMDTSASHSFSNTDENPRKEESHLPVISPLPDYVGDPITEHEGFDKLKAGDFFFHMNYGKGEILSKSKMGNDKVVRVQFESGSKMLVLVPSGIFRKING